RSRQASGQGALALANECHWLASAAVALVSRWGSGSSEPAEEPPHVAHQQTRHFMRRKVTAMVVHVPGDDVGVVAVREAADAAEVASERGDADRDAGRLGRLLGGGSILVGEAWRRASRAGPPIEHDVG